MTLPNFSMDQINIRDEAVTGARNVLKNPKLALTHKDNTILFQNKAAYIAAYCASNTPGGWKKLAEWAEGSALDAKASEGKLHQKVKAAMIATDTAKADVSDNAVSNYRRPVAAMAYAAAQVLDGNDDALRIMAAALPIAAYRPMGTAVENASAENPISVETLGQIGLDEQDKANAKAAAKQTKPEAISKAALKEALENVISKLSAVAQKRGQGVTMDGASEKNFDAAFDKVEELLRKL